MSEFCYDCYKKILRGKKKKRQLVLSKHFELCEGCGKIKQVVIREKRLSAQIFDAILFAFAKKDSGKSGSDAEMFDDIKNHFEKE